LGDGCISSIDCITFIIELEVRSQLITRNGFNKLKKELDHLWRIERPETTKKVTWAASLGDRSENADYQYNKKRLREIDWRVRYLRKQIENLQIIDYSPSQEGKVYFGAWVEIANELDEVKRFQVAGYDEIFDRKDTISVDSPMARALLGKQIDDEIIVKVGSDDFYWWITKIEYIH